MIPKIIHYCWFGSNSLPELALKSIASWHKHMPDWEFKLWNEDNFDINYNDYTREAYTAGKYAFVSDVARLYALKQMGGVYLDVDFEVFKPFDELLSYHAFAGFEGSKHSPVMMGVCASEPNGHWVSEMLETYRHRHFIKEDRTLDLTTNVQFITGVMIQNGFRANGQEQDYKDCHIFPVDYFSPRRTTGERIITENTYCEHIGLNSWGEKSPGWKERILQPFRPKHRARLIKLKRLLFG